MKNLIYRAALLLIVAGVVLISFSTVKAVAEEVWVKHPDRVEFVGPKIQHKCLNEDCTKVKFRACITERRSGFSAPDAYYVSLHRKCDKFRTYNH